MANFVVLIILLVIVGSAVFYIRKAKKSGVQCIGCPEAGSCASKSGCGCSCHSDAWQK